MQKSNIWLHNLGRPFGWLGGAALGCAFVIVGAPSSQAAVSTVAWYKLGEDGGLIEKDSSGNGNDLTINGSPTISSDTSPFSAGSTLSGNFTSGDFLSVATPTTAVTGVAMEAWVNAATANQTATAVYNGNPSANGYGFYDLAGTWTFLEGGHSYNFADPVVAGAWTHLAVTVDSGGTLRGYINGRRAVTNAVAPYTPIGNLNIAGAFAGKVDQVRVMTFDDASFPLYNLLTGSGASPTTGYRNSFESSDTGSYFIDTNETLGNPSAHAGVASNASGYGNQASDGSQFLSFNGGQLSGNAYVISRPFITGDANGTVSFDYGNWGGVTGETQAIRIELLDAATNSVYWTWTGDLTDLTPTQGFAMAHFSQAYTSLAEMSVLRITDLSGTGLGSDGLLDNLIVTAPEPGSAILLAAAAAILPARRRCRR